MDVLTWFFFFLFTKQGLKQKFPREFVDPEILALLEFDWHAFLDNQKKVFWSNTEWWLYGMNGILYFFNIGHSQNRIVALFLVFHMEMCRTSPLLTSCDILFWLKEMRGEMWQFSSGVMCFVDGQFIGDNEALITWAKDQWAFTCDEPEACCVDEYYLKHLQATRASLTSNHSKP